MFNTGRADYENELLTLKITKQYVQKDTQIKEHGELVPQWISQLFRMTLSRNGRRRWMLVWMIRAKRHSDRTVPQWISQLFRMTLSRNGRQRRMLVWMIRAKRHSDRTQGPVVIVTVQDDPKQKRKIEMLVLRMILSNKSESEWLNVGVLIFLCDSV